MKKWLLLFFAVVAIAFGQTKGADAQLFQDYEWGTWTLCTKTCGSGTRHRTKICEPGPCQGDDVESEVCSDLPCPEKPCGGVVSAPYGTIASPHYPSEYPAHQNCTWHFKMQPGMKITFSVDEFDLQASIDCSFDYLEAHQPGSNNVNTYCGHTLVQGSMFESTGNEYFVTFVSDSYESGNGFSIRYESRSIPNCYEGFCANDGICSGDYTCDCPSSSYLGYRCLYETHSAVSDAFIPTTFPLHGDELHVCALFGMDHVMTFDRRFGRFTGSCQYKMANLYLESILKISILVRRRPNCTSSEISCNEAVTVISESEALSIGSDGTIEYNGERIDAAVNKGPFLISFTDWNVIMVDVLDARLSVDMYSFSITLEIDTEGTDWKTEGLCGYLNNDVDRYEEFNHASLDKTNTNTFLEVSNSVIFENAGETCLPALQEDQANCKREFLQSEIQVCNVLYTSAFTECRERLDVKPYYKACLEDACRCDITKQSDCHCSVVASYSMMCTYLGYRVRQWRTENLCSVGCLNNKVYTECGSTCSMPTCANPTQGTCSKDTCNEMCECPGDTYWDEEESWCLPLSQCPCSHGGKSFQPGEEIIQNCNTCLCTGAIWECGDNVCPGLASVTGFSHYETFDGLPYKYPGRCTYAYAYHCDPNVPSTFAIYIQTAECGSSGDFSCLQTVKIFSYMPSLVTSVTLSPGGDVLNNENSPSRLPFVTGGISVYALSSQYIEVIVNHAEVSVLWNKRSNIYVKVPPQLQDKVCGLGGKYNAKSADDLTSKDGLTTTSTSFSQSWEFSSPLEPCVEVQARHACVENSNREITAEQQCAIICSDLFSECHGVVSCRSYQDKCRDDVCSCETGTNCVCDAIADYALKCARENVYVYWRNAYFCGVTCSGDTVFHAASTSCGRTCRSQMEKESCTEEILLEGCNCPKGKYLSNDGETCVDLKECPCYHEHTWVDVGHVIHQKSAPCYCINGKIVCNNEQKLPDEADLDCPSFMEKRLCSNMSQGQSGVECMQTCINKGEPCPDTQCKSGCICPENFVYHNGDCILPNECPCRIHEKEFAVGSITDSGCEKIQCTSSGWEVTSRDNCYDECQIVGGAYYQTFDNRRFAFRGMCEYLLATDSCNEVASNDDFLFRITAQSRDCPGSNQAMCETEIRIIIGIYGVVLKKGIDPQVHIITRSSSDLRVYDWLLQPVHLGMYTVIYAKSGTGEEITIAWDGSTKSYIRFNEKMRDHTTCGMCGNNDGDFRDDFNTLTMESAVSAESFGNYWKVDPLCANQNATSLDNCGSKKSWAQEKCSILYSEAFANCHNVVELDYFYETCVSETCSCDSGGDCECFCTAVSAYAYACAKEGVLVNWRRPSVCPTMCESYNTGSNCVWEYQPCQLCTRVCCNETDMECFPSCFEGCYPACPNGTVYDKTTNECRPEEDCDCINGPIGLECQDGGDPTYEWTEWFSSSTPSIVTGGEYEKIETLHRLYNTCEEPRTVECRSKYHPTAGLQNDVICNKNSGLTCLNYNQDSAQCDDYEIRLECPVCRNCTDVICKEGPPCGDNEELQVIGRTEDNCCKQYECNCIGCLHNNVFKEPNETWTVNCTTSTCVDDGAGCYITSTSRVSCLRSAPDCPHYTEEVETTYEDGCCITHDCVCKNLKIPECVYPEVLRTTQYIYGELACNEHTCSCHEDNSTFCVDSAICSQPGCHNEDTEKCGCVTSSTCVCNPSNCPQPQTCPSCTELQKVGSAFNITSPDNRCAEDACCDQYKCVDVICEEETSNVTCKDWESKVLLAESKCCPSYSCICNETKLHYCPESSLECPETHVETKVREEGQCCYSHKCVCEKCIDEAGLIRSVGDIWHPASDPFCKVLICNSSLVADKCPEIKVLYDERKMCSIYPLVCRQNEELRISDATGSFCCPEQQCACVNCTYGDSTMAVGHIWTENCIVHECASDDNGCYEVKTKPVVCEETSHNCPDFSVMNVTKEGCCNTYSCSCRPAVRQNCTYPQTEQMAWQTEGNLSCPIYKCLCPSEEDMDKTKCLNTSNACSNNGCSSVKEEVCKGCVTDVQCECNPDECSTLLTSCPPCSTREKTAEASVVTNPDNRCVENSCCDKYECVKVDCGDTTSPTCEDWESKVRVNDDECCPTYSCICNETMKHTCPVTDLDCPDDHTLIITNAVGECCDNYSCLCSRCTDEIGRLREVDEKWDLATDPNCTEMACFRHSSDDANTCPTIEVVYDRHDYCSDHKPTCKRNEELLPKDDFICCEEYDCVCMNCTYGNTTVAAGHIWTENCIVHECASDDNGCYEVKTKPVVCEEKSHTCPDFSFMNVTKEGCCNTYSCSCRPAVRQNCTYPQTEQMAWQTEGNLSCPIYTCLCPSEEDMDKTKCLNTSNACSNNGCSSVKEEVCKGCVTDVQCECNPDDCSTLLTSCPPCSSREKTAEASVVTNPDNRCAENSCCDKYECVKVDCDDTTSPTCEDWESKESVAVEGSCCPKTQCTCDSNKTKECPKSNLTCGLIETKVKVGELNKCCDDFDCVCDWCLLEEGQLRGVGETWPNATDRDCVTMECFKPSEALANECPIIKVSSNLRDQCSPLITTCDQACQELVTDEENSDACCTVNKCVPSCNDKGICYKNGQEWKDDTEDCSRKQCSCTGKGCNIITKELDCPAVEQLDCPNGKARTYRNPENPCCNIQECICECNVFGDPHYQTFDGKGYTFQGQCNYTLVEFRHTDLLHIYSENYACNYIDNLKGTCLKSVYVRWGETVVKLTGKSEQSYESLAFVDGALQETFPWTHSGIELSARGIFIFLDIPEIQLNLVFYTGTFSTVKIQVFPSVFFNQSIGLCGTCSQEQLDDYETRDGKLVEDTYDFGYSWELDGGEEECLRCDLDDGKCEDDSSTCVAKIHPCFNCTENPCEAFDAEVFDVCKQYLDVTKHAKFCEYDTTVLGMCTKCNATTLMNFALECQKWAGICVKWKEALNCSLDDMKCPGDLVYKECTSECETRLTCENKQYLEKCSSTKEISGCFCPEGQVPRSEGSISCVDKNEECCELPATNLTCVPPMVLSYTSCKTACGPCCVCDASYTCSEMIVNCTKQLGCRAKPTIQDSCGCPIDGQCECNTDLCPIPPQCGSCMQLKEIKPATSVTINDCEGCCPVYQCVEDTCSGTKWTLENVPNGYRLDVRDGDSPCCPRLSCDVCFLKNLTIMERGKKWIEMEDGCSLTYGCTQSRGPSDPNGYDEHGCFQTELQSDPREECPAKESVVCKVGEEVVEVTSSNPCCKAYGCNCSKEVCPKANLPTEDCCKLQRTNSLSECCPEYQEVCTPQNELQYCNNAPLEVLTDIKNVTSKCEAKKTCVCTTNKELLSMICLGAYIDCNETTHEVVSVPKEVDYFNDDPQRCCPDYICSCKNCTDEDPAKLTCKIGFIKVNETECGCVRYKCVPCDNCKSSITQVTYQPGVNWTEYSGEGCPVTYTCEAATEIDTCHLIKEIDTCKPPPSCDAFHSPCQVENDHCCPDWDCCCNACPESYIPPPDNLEPYESIEFINNTENSNHDCCKSWRKLCNACMLENGTYVSTGQVVEVIEKDGCSSTKVCSNERGSKNDSFCFLMKSTFSEKDSCQSRESFEEATCKLNHTYAIATSSYDTCCQRYECVCHNETVLSEVCPEWNKKTEKCCELQRTNSLSECCPEYQEVCTPQNELQYCNNAPLEVLTDIKNVTSKCEAKKTCVCTTNKELLSMICLGAYIDCNETTHEVVSVPKEVDYFNDDPQRCCPDYICSCKNCTDEDPAKLTCKIGFIKVNETECGCVRYKCVPCDNCKSSITQVTYQPGVNWTEYSGEGCPVTYTCEAATEIDTCHLIKEIDTCKPPPSCDAFHSPCQVENDHCCPDWDCCCNACPESYIPPPDNLEPYESIEFINNTENSNHDCCKSWRKLCNACMLENGTYVSTGQVVEVIEKDGCSSTKVCSNERGSKNDSFCFLMKSTFSEKDSCQSRESFEEATCKLNHTYAIATSSYDTCCQRYECVCHNETVLSEVCPEWNKKTEKCCELQRTNSLSECCPEYQEVCTPQNELQYCNNAPLEVLTDIKNVTSKCEAKKTCVCTTNKELLSMICLGAYIDCNETTHEVVSVPKEVDYLNDDPQRCCPDYICSCKNCTDEDPAKLTCEIGFIKVNETECGCVRYKCVPCDNCKSSITQVTYQPGVNWTEYSGEGCPVTYTCEAATEIDTCHLIKEIDTCKPPPSCDAFHSPCQVENDHCCPDWDCCCNACPESYIPSPDNLEPYESIEFINNTENSNHDCCKSWRKLCNACMLENGTYVSTGQVVEVIEKDGCSSTKVCSNERGSKNDSFCFLMKSTFSEKDSCQSRESFEEATCKLNHTYAIATSSYDTCCQRYECVCHNETVLSEVCPEWNKKTEKCCELQRTNSLSECCPEYQEVCTPQNELQYCNNAPLEVLTDIKNVTSKCEAKKTCVCTTNKELFSMICLGAYIDCNETTHEVVSVPKEVDYLNDDPQRCCPDYICSCKNCTDEDPAKLTCKIGFIKVNETECGCVRYKCVPCDNCKSSITQVTYQPGVNWTEYSGEGCPVTYTCEAATEIDTCHLIKEIDTCKPPPSCDAFHSPCQVENDHCCPDWDCCCNACPESYIPPPDNLEPYESIEFINNTENSNHDCCKSWRKLCNACMLENGTYVSTGQVVEVIEKDGCSSTKVCSNERGSKNDSFCFLMKSTSSEKDSCQTLENYEELTCNAEYQYAEEIDNKGSCCPRFKCSCKPCSPSYNATKPSVKSHHAVVELSTEENPNQNCCPRWRSACQNDSSHCVPPKCPVHQTFKFTEEKDENCCPMFDCICLPTNDLITSCDQWYNYTCPLGFLKKEEEQPPSSCCPKYRCVCDTCVIGSTVYPVNKSWVAPDDICSANTCIINEETSCPEVVTSRKFECPSFDSTKCIMMGGRVATNASTQHCCEYCEYPSPCERGVDSVILNATLLTHKCWTDDKVDVSYCVGSCPSSHVVDEDSGEINEKCRCCKPAMSAPEEINMRCDDGIIRSHTLTVVMTCTCMEIDCNTTPQPNVFLNP